ncbi:succinate-semialdehyde dehydrogenase [Mycobacterium antarcticum]|uniref:NAD-dependent succinate-semialdehyde dehydrogenase n=1 Tax=unclassified Mycolicibacterium TaxID=2636767 RepID=UPI0023967EFA|nr:MULTISPECIES: NAD-dependent succinate-semialdehyde dehydrogenase [unclassified Mycolicibacterium]BDX29835.1 succinate-semialdehyde dehydrogenase [Mycolicibacterium sp. TUM20985]GLP73258.1 succinate-semialdehyde dehydrogenase [Mycolicibacterium sp. TUM20983]GLP78972.1 succinate-semialdehyde dehydrogenase [Mycolicibacterium sp. TUM20984]
MTATVATQPKYQVVNPATGEPGESFDFVTDAELEATLAASAEAYRSWRDLPIAERARIVARVGELFKEHASRLGAIATEEMGKPLEESVGEADFCGDIFDYFATEGPTLTADQEIKTFASGKAYVQKLPIGPLLGIMPWNYPFYQIARFAAPNLVLGNTIILKHAESVPKSALAVQELMDEAGVPEGVYRNIFASYAQIEQIIGDRRVVGVSLTGSERAGAVVASIAGRNLKKCVLELGGSDPYVVLDSDDVKASADLAWDTRIGNTGQACNSNKRIIVTDDIFDGFVERLVERAKDLKPGDPAEAQDGTFAPLSSRKAAEILDEQVKDAVTKGATLHAGGELGQGPAAYYSPAVLTGITKEMRAYREELFGPVAVVYSVSSDEEALELANDTDYGLGGAVFSTDTQRAEQIARRLESGMANVNTPANEGQEVPFGGVKRSGFGRELGPLGMDEFVNKRMYFVAG